VGQWWGYGGHGGVRVDARTVVDAHFFNVRRYIARNRLRFLVVDILL
jgi:hypothetical protein